MDKQMFCFQCEQTAGCSGCTGKTGVCGKTADTAGLQDELTGALIGLARACANNERKETTDRVVIEGLFTTVTNVAFDDNSIREMIRKVNAEKSKIVPDCAACASRCGNTDNYDMTRMWNANEDIRSLKSLILFGIRGMAAYAYHAMVLGYKDPEVNDFFYKALFVLAEDWGMEELLPVVMEVGKVNLSCMALLDKANTETFGTPEPVTHKHIWNTVQTAQVQESYCNNFSTRQNLVMLGFRYNFNGQDKKNHSDQVFKSANSKSFIKEY